MCIDILFLLHISNQAFGIITSHRRHRRHRLSVASKLLERLVAQQLLAYLNKSGLLPRLQSAYRAGHSTETAVLKVLSDILLAIDAGDLSALVLLCLRPSTRWTMIFCFNG